MKRKEKLTKEWEELKKEYFEEKIEFDCIEEFVEGLIEDVGDYKKMKRKEMLEQLKEENLEVTEKGQKSFDKAFPKERDDTNEK